MGALADALRDLDESRVNSLVEEMLQRGLASDGNPGGVQRRNGSRGGTVLLPRVLSHRTDVLGGNPEGGNGASRSAPSIH